MQVCASHGIQHHCGIQHRARHRRDVGYVAEPVLRVFLRHHAKALLESDDAVARCRNARRSAAVGGNRDRHQTGRNRNRRSTARAARTAIRAPGIARASEQRRLRQALLTELRRCRLAHDDGAGLLQSRHGNRIMIGNVVFEDQRTPGGADIRCRDQVLHRDRNSMQRSERRPLHHRRLGCARHIHRGIGGDGDECVQHRLAALDAIECRLHDLDRRHRPATDQPGQFGGGRICEVHVCSLTVADHVTPRRTGRQHHAHRRRVPPIAA